MFLYGDEDAAWAENLEGDNPAAWKFHHVVGGGHGTDLFASATRQETIGQLTGFFGAAH